MEKELSIREARVAAALMSEPTLAAAARKAGVSERTVYRYLRLERVQKQLRRGRGQLFSAALSGMREAWSESGPTLVKVMHDEKASGSAKVSAVRTALRAGENARLYDELEGRLVELEDAGKKGAGC